MLSLKEPSLFATNGIFPRSFKSWINATILRDYQSALYLVNFHNMKILRLVSFTFNLCSFNFKELYHSLRLMGERGCKREVNEKVTMNG